MIEPLADVMNYYGWCFSAYVLALIIILVNTVKSYKSYIISKEEVTSKDNAAADLIISVLCGVILDCGIYFQGILADNAAPGLTMWSRALLLIGFASFVLFVVQLLFYIKTYDNSCL